MVMSPGPNGALLLKTVPVSGKKHGYVNVLGVVAAFYYFFCKTRPLLCPKNRAARH